MTQQADEMARKAAHAENKVFIPAKAVLGGSVRAVPFSGAQADVLLAFADVLIPPTGGFPAPSRTGILGYFGRYIVDHRVEAAHFPFINLDAVDKLADQLGTGFLPADREERTLLVQRLSEQDESLFLIFQALVYFAYYAQPEVVRAIQASGPAAGDFHGPPQPYGYPGEEPWDPALLSHGRGTYARTQDIQRVDVDFQVRVGLGPDQVKPAPQAVPDLETGTA
ncbi:hypothetical protein ACFQ36_05020 [Arthrobacter sp. GCM10027362]|uniref:hypothetical protein n=1 Tax=Arthrobacter sp. GCM10027362 TaxID=3273379 RepID=UPI00363D44DE